MGVNVSNEKSEQYHKLVSDQVNKSLMKVLKKSSKTTTITQDFLLKVFDNSTLECGSLTVTQDASSDVQSMTDLSSALVNEAKNELKEELNMIAKKEIELQNDALNTGQVNVTNTVSNSRQIVNNTLENYFESIVETDTSVDNSISQILHIMNYNDLKVKDSCIFTQSAVLKAISDDVATTVIDNLASNETIAKLFTDLEVKVKMKNTGLFSTSGIIAIIAAVGVVAAFGVMYKTRKGGGSDDK
mgnify:CR=1 FL=1